MTLFETFVDMSNKQKEQWAKIRSKGRTRYVFLHGVLKLGVIFTMIGYLGDIIFEVIWASWFGPINRDPSGHFISKIIVGMILGFIIGIMNWVQNEKNYKNSEVN